MYFLISGKRYSGKDTTAELLRKVFLEHSKMDDVKINITSFAEEAKNGYCHTNNLNNNFEDRSFKESHRKALIDYCRLTKRVYGDSIFAEKVIDKHQLCNNNIVIISDVRFKEEIEAFSLRKLPFMIIRVESNDINRVQRGWNYDPEIDGGISECQLDNFHFDAILENNNDKTDLYNSIKKLIL